MQRGANVAWRLLDSQFWGVPQRRKRIFLVGDFRAERSPEILFKCESELGYIDTRRPKKERIAAAFVSNFEIEGGLEENNCVADFGRTADRIYYNADKARTLTASTGDGGSATGNYLDISEIRPINLQVATRCKALGERTGLGIGDNGDPAYTLQEQHSHAVFAAVYPMRDPDLNKKANGFIVSEEGAPAPTLSATDRHAIAACFASGGFGGYSEGMGPLRASGGNCGGGSENLIIIFNKIAYFARCILRKLTPLECERLQGFPDNWTKYGKSGAQLKDAPRYRALGNSLTVPCAERIFRGILAVVNDTAAIH